MSFLPPSVDIRSPPNDFDSLVEWLERWSYGLVLGENYSLTDLRGALDAVERSVRGHRIAAEAHVTRLGSADEETADLVRVVLQDHVWFETSLAQFRWFLDVVDQEDHGGHRQALGQYGRILADSLRRHRRDERKLEARSIPRTPGPTGSFEKR